MAKKLTLRDDAMPSRVFRLLGEDWLGFDGSLSFDDSGPFFGPKTSE